MKRLIQSLLLLPLATLGTPESALSQSSFDEIIAFGQSDIDAGNAHILSTIFGPPFTVTAPYWGHRLSNGPLWVERLAERLGIGTPTEDQPVPQVSLAGGTNFGFGGTTTGEGITCFSGPVFRGGACAPNMRESVDLYLAGEPVLDGDELFVIAPGGNDASPVSAAHNMAIMVGTLAQAGARDILVANLVRFRHPAIDPADYPQQDRFVETLDTTLQADLDVVESLFPAITIYRLDLLALSDQLLADPEEVLGITNPNVQVNTTDPACPGCGGGLVLDPTDFVEDPSLQDLHIYWDFFHFTRVVHELFGNAAADLVGAPAGGSGN